MLARTMRSSAIAGLLAVSCLAPLRLARAQDSAPPPNRLALVIGEAGYVGDSLPTAANDAALVATTLRAEAFDVSELHELDTPSLASGYRTFLDKARAAPPGATITVYLAGLGVNVGCDDYLLPIDAHIKAPADIPRIALSMTRVMSDLAQTGSLVRVVLLDGARPVPPSVSEIPLPKGLIPLSPPNATTFGLAAEIHDLESPPKAGDANDAYASGLTNALQQAYGDVDTTMRETRVAVHQATGGEQTPWHATNASTPPFAFALNVTEAQAQAASGALPNAGGGLSGLDPQAAYWAAIWRNTVANYNAYLDAFANSAPPNQVARVRALLALLELPNPICEGHAAMPAAPAMAAPICPDGFFANGRADGDFCSPGRPSLPCPPGTLSVIIGGAPVCKIVSSCPPGLHPIWTARGWICEPPRLCQPGMTTIWDGNAWDCQRPPICKPGVFPIWTPRGWICEPPRSCPQGATAAWTPNGWFCRPPCLSNVANGCPPPPCKPGERGCLPNVPPCVVGRPGCESPPPVRCNQGQVWRGNQCVPVGGATNPPQRVLKARPLKPSLQTQPRHAPPVHAVHRREPAVHQAPPPQRHSLPRGQKPCGQAGLRQC